MNRRILFTGIILVVFTLVAGMGLLLLSNPAPAAAQGEEATTRTIQVSGQGQVNVAPDQAVVSLGVDTEADTAESALADNNDRMTAVISATLEAGIAEEDIRTQGISLQPVYDFSGEDQPELTGYRASNIVRITVRDLAQLGDLLDTAVSAGGNTINGIQFEVSNQTDLEAAAREAAMTAAQQKAEQLTELAGATLGPVQTIIETGSSTPITAPTAQDEVLESGVPVQPGTQTIQASVQVIWEIQ